ncbi:hypothetical protein H310_10642 [Aphanomyces invadans]|uniref:Uncharacterized protein n=1 Tax=Aphanomyces invadans TaxID=157072 RepID=A0A024TPC1_9STRA|nr:hypothetical protein H310_10642 [Aphanomyces invadans]ETV95985.1 hypothetical protein H310_10642 [Aphanomyces invadans]|eukprot:XP_008875296.1 hypothetical protein H310_10642 [Aphanomyces invadans]
MNILKKSLTRKENAAPEAPSDDKTQGDSKLSRASAGAAATTPPITVNTAGEASPGTQIRHGSVLIDTRMSDSIFDHILGRGRAIDVAEADSKKLTKPATPTIRFSTMDSNVEYWDKDGVHRRSTTISKRMNLRGVAIPNAIDPLTLVDTGTDDPTPSSPRSQKDMDRIAKQQIMSKQNHIEAVDAALQRALAEAYKSPPLSKLALAAAQHTANAPSKQLQFVDEDGNVRRLKRSAHDTPRSEPPETPTTFV